MSLLARFARNDRGNIATMFALAMVPIIGAVGVSIDYGRVAQIRVKLADALDAGVLAVGTQAKMSDAAAFKIVNDWVSVHMGTQNAPYWHLDSVTQDADGKITAIASGAVDTTIARILGVTTIPISVHSEAVRSQGKVELALVLDNTGSMRGTKIANLKDAANKLVDTLAAASADPADLKVALVPFSQTVNVGPSYSNASWLDVAGASAAARSLFLGQKVNRFSLFQKVGKNWGGCVETRAPAYEVTDTDPVGNNPDTQYVPYFAPDEPGNKGSNSTYNNSYLNDSSMPNILKALGLSKMDPNIPQFQYLQGDITKYSTTNIQTGTTDAMNYQYGPNSGCEIAPLVRLQSDIPTIKTGIDNMIANGNTDIPIGLTWGWNALAPNGPFGDGLAYHTTDWTKIVVLMTDGNNENEVGNDQDESYYSGIGYIWQGRMGMTSGSKSKRTAARDATLAQMCTAMKAKGIVIYTVRVEVTNGSSSVLQNCASDSDKFFDVQDSSNLVAAFENIGGSIQQLRLAE